MRVAIYCRVSTENQEREGTSLDSQREACLARAKELGYEVPGDCILLETYSGLTLDRPKLMELREWVRSNQIDAVISYTLDRMSRDPVHFIIVQDEMEKYGVKLVLVTETLDSSDLGKLIIHIKGYAAKLEAQKILERTTRGRRERIKAGKLPTGRGILYGYDYDRQTGTNIANSWLDTVRLIGMWILEEGISLNEACRRLMKAEIPAPKGGVRWSRGTLGRIFHNPAYAGKSQAYKTKTLPDKRRRANDAEKLVEIPNAVDRAAFTWDEWLGIQKQLQRNREMSPRNQKLHYLLRGMVYCKRDGCKYYGVPVHGQPYYRCSGRSSLLPDVSCKNKTYNAEKLEAQVWNEISRILSKPDLVLEELQKQMESETNVSHLQEQVELYKKRLEAYDQTDIKNIRLYHAGLWLFERLEKETLRMRKEQARIGEAIAELETQIQKAKELELNAGSIRELCQRMSKAIENCTFEDKQMALESLAIKVWIDGELVEIEGVLPVCDVGILSQPS